ncbi:hypothetical protein LQ384_26095 [Rhodococcus rhodochrous]|uniref:Uncharacterized protein n=1 Tax=Rhodococcus rhodochrous TaxID=1829 RepID=A0AAW4XPS6_RHORH|nr:hypothetical protein [Rhodococcus rhodochrous]MCD2114580.1 hypothetical protein [Rhodococcus rhodochrous]
MAFSPLSYRRLTLRSPVSIYVDLSFSQRELMSVYFAELVNVPDASRADLRLRQRANVEQWSSYLQAICDGLSAADARFLMYAAINLVPDLGPCCARPRRNNRRSTSTGARSRCPFGGPVSWSSTPLHADDGSARASSETAHCTPSEGVRRVPQCV